MPSPIFPVSLPNVKIIGSSIVGVPSTPAIRQKYDIHLEPYRVDHVQFVEGEQVVDWGVKFLKAQDVHAKTRGEKSAVFILDTGGKYNHPDLVANVLDEYTRNFSDAPTADDNHGHSSHCGGLGCASDNNIGVLGMAPGAKLIPVKVLNDEGSGSWQGVASGIRYVADLQNFSYRKIISMSLGGRGGNPVLKEAIEYALGKGVFIVAAAGNDGYSGSDSVNFPGAYPGVLAIASIGPNGKPSSFSSGGPAVALAAPGENNLSTHLNGGYVRMSGTSMATPHVAGAVALILSAHPEITKQSELIDFLKKGATDLFTPGNDVRTGAGAPILTGYFFA